MPVLQASASFRKGLDMLKIFKRAALAIVAVVAVSAAASDAQARSPRNFPLTLCGPDLAYLCPMNGYFNLTPFRYSLAVYPGCLQRQRVETPTGVRSRLVLVCG